MMKPIRLNIWGPVILSILWMTVNCAGQAHIDYDCPTFCQCATIPDRVDAVQLHCTVPYLNEQYRNFSYIPGPMTTWLTVHCKLWDWPSQLLDHGFAHFKQLEEIMILECNFKILTQNTFIGLESLKHLTINKAGTPILEPGIFLPLVSLQSFTLTQNKIERFEDGIFCTLSNLHTLDISQNLISEEENLGLHCEGENCHCMPNITTLDIRRNILPTLKRPYKSFTKMEHILLGSCSIKSLDSELFRGLGQLQELDLSNNSLREIPNDLFTGLNNLTHLYLESNTITELDPLVFKDLGRLLILNLNSNKVSSKNLSLDILSQFGDLWGLDIGNNGITDMSGCRRLFAVTSKLTYLKLSHNKIESIPDTCLSLTPLLRMLHLDHNILRHISNETLAGLSDLRTLNLTHNRIVSVDKAAFSHTPLLTNLTLSFNALSRVPSTIQNLRHLVILDLQENLIQAISPSSFKGLQSLQGLRISNNNISYVPKQAFSDMPNLMVLNLNNNNIRLVEYGAFQGLNQLQYLTMEYNKIQEIKLLFHNLPVLSNVRLKHNEITLLEGFTLPPSLMNLDLSNNQIRDISFFVFSHLPRLLKVDLSHNKMQRFYEGQLQISSATQVRPQFSLRGNILTCTCNDYWLKTINDNTIGTYPFVTDLPRILCISKYHDVGFLVELQAADLMCEYGADERGECAFLDQCPCCNEENCSCTKFYQCPKECVCVNNLKMNVIIVDCGEKDFDKVPPIIPYRATKLILSGNNITTLYGGIFSNNDQIDSLLLDHNELDTIHPDSFVGLSKIKSLDLRGNRLVYLHEWTFRNLSSLEVLILSGNLLTGFDNHTFSPLLSLKELYLDDNKLAVFDSAIFTDNGLLNTLTLSNNPWSCDCETGPEFQGWLTANAKRVQDLNNITCLLDPQIPLGNYITSEVAPVQEFLGISFKSCYNNTLLQERLIYRSNRKLTMALATVGIIFLVTVTLSLLLFNFRELIKVWLFTRYGLRFYKPSEDASKRYDAFISYSSIDERVVVRELAPRLENGLPQYKLCLHYRDWPVGSSIADTIIASVESSRRTIMLLSENYVKSEWCHYEFQAAHHQVLKDKKNRLIVIVLDDEPPKKLDNHLKLYIKTNTYLKWKDPWFWEKLKYAMPDKSKDKDSLSDNKKLVDECQI